MNRFAFIVHPIDISDVARKYPITRWLPNWLVESVVSRMSPRYVSKIEGIRSATGAEAEGWFVGCPLTSRQLVEGDERLSTRKIALASRSDGGVSEEVHTASDTDGCERGRWPRTWERRSWGWARSPR